MTFLSDEWSGAPGTPGRLGIVSAGSDRRAAEEIYRPLRPGARAALSIRRRILTRRPSWSWPGSGAAPPPIVSHSLVAPLLEGATGVSVMAGSSDRFLIGVAREDRLDSVLKVGDLHDRALANEASWLADPPAFIETPLLRHHLVDRRTRVLVMSAIEGFWKAPLVEVGTIVEICIQLQSQRRPIIHGDLAPWNVAHIPRGEPGQILPVIIDWERSRVAAEPLTDLTQYLVQEQSQLHRRGGADALLEELVAPQRAGWRCLTALGLEPASGTDHLRMTLRSGVVEQTDFPRARRLWNDLDVALRRHTRR